MCNQQRSTCAYKARFEPRIAAVLHKQSNFRPLSLVFKQRQYKNLRIKALFDVNLCTWSLETALFLIYTRTKK